MTTEIDELELLGYLEICGLSKQELTTTQKLLNKWAVAQAELARMNELDRLENQLMKAHGRLSEFEAQYLAERRSEFRDRIKGE